MAQVVALIMVAQVTSAGGGGVTSTRVGEFLSMAACRSAAEHSVSIDRDAATHVSFECVPLSPVSDIDNRR